MVFPLQVFGMDGFGGLALALVIPTLVVAFGSYIGVLMALQSFFNATSWADARDATQDES